jgi:8-oxo-dGTP diphosphatase
VDKFCKFCGVVHSAPEYPKTCTACEQITYVNPTPVAVLLQPVTGADGRFSGIIVGKRGIEPGKGEYGLPGGFIDCGDVDVIEGARREFWEELGVTAPPANRMSLFWSFSNTRQLLLFVRSHLTLDEAEVMAGFTPNFECPEIRIARKPEALCFPSHTRALAMYFDWFNQPGD